jgi:hypothetical protein
MTLGLLLTVATAFATGASYYYDDPYGADYSYVADSYYPYGSTPAYGPYADPYTPYYGGGTTYDYYDFGTGYGAYEYYIDYAVLYPSAYGAYYSDFGTIYGTIYDYYDFGTGSYIYDMYFDMYAYDGLYDSYYGGGTTTSYDAYYPSFGYDYYSYYGPYGGPAGGGYYADEYYPYAVYDYRTDYYDGDAYYYGYYGLSFDTYYYDYYDAYDYYDDYYAAPEVSMDGACPGDIDMTVNVAPGATAGFFFSAETGSLTMPIGSCAGTVTGLGGRPGWGLNVTDFDGDGVISFAPTLPGGACGKFVQVLELDSCTWSNVERIGD